MKIYYLSIWEQLLRCSQFAYAYFIFISDSRWVMTITNRFKCSVEIELIKSKFELYLFWKTIRNYFD